MRIVIVEDHVMFREVVRKVCTREFGHEVVGETGAGEQAPQIILSTLPDLVLLDLVLPGMDGFSIFKAVRRAAPTVRFIAVTAARGDYTLFRVERAGFEGFVDKGTNNVASLRKAIDAVGAGGRYLSAAFVAGKKARLANPISFEKVLTERERAVLSLIGLALSDEEIGRRLDITAKTAETFRHRIFQKLTIKGTPKLIRFAIEHGFTQIPAQDNSAPAFP